PGRGWGLGITSVTASGRGWVLIADSGAWEDQGAGAKEYRRGIVAGIVWVLPALIATGLLHTVTFRVVASQPHTPPQVDLRSPPSSSFEAPPLRTLKAFRLVWHPSTAALNCRGVRG